jgi:hypothetical protein
MYKKTGIALCAAFLLGAFPAQAGFEFVPASSAQRSPVPHTDLSAGPLTPDPSGANDMPALALPPVTAEPLAPQPQDRVLPAKISRDDGSLRINPQPLAKRIPAPANQPFDGDALLDATILGAPLSLSDGADATIPAPRRELEINPFPLQSGTATHGTNTNAMDRGMMEETSMLRPVAVPGGRIPVEQPVPRAPAQEEFSSFENSLAPDFPVQDYVEAEPPPMPPRKPASILATPSPMPQSFEGFAEAVGFGRDLPLALALSQLVPPDYSYSFAQNVDAGTNVSWQGGKPWDEVLNDMLSPSGLRAEIRGRDVMIKPANS